MSAAFGLTALTASVGAFGVCACAALNPAKTIVNDNIIFFIIIYFTQM
jgi:hypothetical protein